MPSGVHSIIARVAPENRWKFDTALSGAVAASLNALSSTGLLRPSIPADHAQELIGGGYAEQTLGGLRLTDTGAVRANMELG